MGNKSTFHRRETRTRSSVLREDPKYMRLEQYFLMHKEDINPELKLAYQQALAGHSKEASDLNLVFEALTGDKLQHLIELMPFYTHIQGLYLWGANLGTTGADRLGPILQHLSNLKDLGLEENQLEDKGTKAIAAGIKPLTGLKTIYLNKNMIGNRGAMSIGKALRNKEKLRTLVLDSNDISRIGLEHILTGLKDNKSLNVLGLVLNRLGDTEVELIMRDMLHLPSLKMILLKGSNISVDRKTQLKKKGAPFLEVLV